MSSKTTGAGNSAPKKPASKATRKPAMPEGNVMTFVIDDKLLSACQHALQAKEFSPDGEQLFNPAYHFGGQIKTNANGWPLSESLDKSKLKPALTLVKDSGIYLMSNGLPRQIESGTTSVVVYAQEADPTKAGGEDWYDAAVRILGGDDCAMNLEGVPEMIVEAHAKGAKQFLVIASYDGDTLHYRFS